MKVFYNKGRVVIVEGVGKLFYQDGFPISLTVSLLGKAGITVSILHVADECMKNEWSGKTTFNKISSDFQDGMDREVDLVVLREFCDSSYERQRELIFNYLFKDKEEAKQWLRRILARTST